MYDSQNIPIALSSIQNETIKNEQNRSGFYRATVVSVKDPWNVGRIQIRIPAFHGANPNSSYYIADSRLPYAWPATFNGAGYKSGQYIIPPVGSLVWVSFETGTDNFIYFGGIYTADPTGSRYIYFDRGVNNGAPVQVVENDIPSDYNPNKYIVFRSPKGTIIEIDDRDVAESIKIADPNGNSIVLGRNGITISSDSPIIADYPYLHTLYIDSNKVPEETEFSIRRTDVFEDNTLNIQGSPIKGNKILYIEQGKCVGSGFIISTNIDDIIISTNGPIDK